jgi:PAS domain S-box-containing protein
MEPIIDNLPRSAPQQGRTDIADNRAVEVSSPAGPQERSPIIGCFKADLENDSWECSEVLDRIVGIDDHYEKKLRCWLSIVHPDDRKALMRHVLEEAIVKHKPCHKEFRIIRNSDQSTRKVNFLGTAEYNTKGNIRSMTGTIQDITEHKGNGDELKLFHAFGDVAPIGIFRTDWEGNNVYSNRRWQEITGLSAAQAVGKGWLRGIHPGDSERLSEAWFKAIVTGGLYAQEHRLVTPQGKNIWVRMLAGKIKNTRGDGHAPGFVGTLRDITELRRQELEC